MHSLDAGSVVLETKASVAGKNIGLIGIGKMGAGIGISLMRHGAYLHIKGNNDTTGIIQLEKLGANVHTDIKTISNNCDVIILVLPSHKEVIEVCLSNDGLLNYMRPESIIIDCTTSNPQTTLEIAKKAAVKNIKFADAPLTRGPKDAELGRLNAILGTDKENISAVNEILAAFCEAIILAGPVGEGHKLKIVNNALSMGLAALAAEVCAFSQDINIDIKTLRALVSRGAINNGLFQGMFSFATNEDPDALAFSIKNAEKDLSYAEDMARDVPYEISIIKQARNNFKAAIARGYGEYNLPYLIKK